MSIEKFSVGPWWPPHLSDDTAKCNCLSVVNEGWAGGIATVHVDNGIVMISEGGNDAPPVEEAKANGHLIAAAPELYHALVETLAIASRNEVGEYVERAKAALAKALGQPV